jgi:uncharacterized membrane protein YebE (DUF533 family)
MSDFGTSQQGFKPKGRKNKKKKRNGGTAGKTILGIGAALGTAYAANQAYQGYQQSQEPKFIHNDASMPYNNPGITSTPRRPTQSAYGPQPPKPIPRTHWGGDIKF